MRAITASGIVPSAIAGRIRCESALRNAPLSAASSESIEHEAGDAARCRTGSRCGPETGVQPRPTENSEDQQQAPPEDRHRVAGERRAHHRVVPDGVALDRGDDARRDADQQREQHRAPATARPSPGSAPTNSESTGSWVMSEMPRSPCSAFQTYSPYCTGQRPVEAELVHQPLVALLGPCRARPTAPRPDRPESGGSGRRRAA